MEYNASFTSAGLLSNEIDSIYDLLIQSDFIKLLKTEVKENKHLRINSEVSRQRVVGEIKKRVLSTDNTFWMLYGVADEKEKKLLLFYLILKTYRLVYEFHFRVTVPMMQSLDTTINSYRYKMLLDEIASENEAVASWSKKTWEKLISRYIHMMSVAGLASGGKLMKPEVGYSFYQFFIDKAEYWVLDAFFLKNHEKEQVINYRNDN